MGVHRRDCLAHRESGQQPPKVVPTIQLGKLALTRASAEALEGGDRDVFLVECRDGNGLAIWCSQPDQTLEITVPQAAFVSVLSGLDSMQPLCN